ncbi:hypothetical protein SSX86_013128 [Deinandra increscens subsp. villosa]|uniref:UDENN domain-containing protein n=1 Tax=Deinandra increscens subsp. villosa TaxID=3103831 RepID=A0AAP0H253_9ASTR
MTTVGSGHRRSRSEFVTSSDNQTNGFQRFKTHMQRALNWGSGQDQAFFNPEILANQKRQWCQFQSKIPQSIKIQPLFLNTFLLRVSIQMLISSPVEDAFAKRKKWEAKADKAEIKIMHFRSPPVVMMEPQILFKYPPGNSIVAQERLNRITQFVSEAGLDHVPSSPKVNNQEDESARSPRQQRSWMDSAIPVDGTLAISVAPGVIDDRLNSPRSPNSPSKMKPRSPYDYSCDASDNRREYFGKMHGDHDSIRKASIEACSPVKGSLERVRSSGPLFSSVRGVVTEDEDGVLSCSDRYVTNNMIIEWAKENKNDLLQIVCGYHALPVPLYGGKVHFKPLEHLPAIEYYRIAFAFGEDPNADMSMIPDKVKFKLAAIEEAVSLSNWTTITVCRALSVQNVLILLAAVLLEKQVIITSPNLGVLSATVLSLIPMILPFEWQSLFLPVLPGKMFDFLDAPVPFVVGILHKPSDYKMKSNNIVHVNLADNKVEMSSLPPLPKQRELMTKLGPLHARLSSDKIAAKKHPVYKCNKWQIDAATQFLAAMRQHLESLCSNLSDHAITSVQCDNEKVSVLLKESYIDSFPYRDRPFIREFVDTQMFSVLSDTRLSRPEY